MHSAKTGLIISAAFIGPGTVTTATLAGAQLGYGLIWALILSVFATYIVQEMASRLGLVTGQGLSENLANCVSNPVLKWVLYLLVIAALGIGNAAYEGGNLSGAALGLSSLFSGNQSTWVAILSTLTLIAIWLNSYKWLEKILIVLVCMMSLVFVLVALTAGLTSAITAPLATAYALSGLFYKQIDTTHLYFKLIASIVIAIGAVIALSGYRPLSIILIAQASNAILLPFILVILFLLMNNKNLLGMLTNGKLSNTLGFCTIILVGLLSAEKLF